MIVSFTKLGTHGKLGNQLFQCMAVLGIAEKNNAEACFPEWEYEKYFVKELPHTQSEHIYETIKEQQFHYVNYQINLKTNTNPGIDLFGYFQSEKYFPKENPFKFKPEFLDSVREKTPYGLFDKETILIHIRRGDYVGNPCYYQLPITYFIDALLTHFPQWPKCNIVIISDDIPYCKVHFSCLPNVFFADDFNDIESIALASLCDHFIIPNSSFGWWCSWLGEKKHSKIVHPGHLFAGKLLENNTKDFWPERWTRFQKDSYTIDLTDTTFTIPVFHDHRDRKQNLDLCVCMLQTSFDTNIIVGEQGTSIFQYMKQWCRYIKFEERSFHRTRMLNVMAMASKTPYIANWDADVMIAPLQIYLAVLKLREGADMVFPYDGRFARWPREEWFKKLEKTIDLGVFAGTQPKGHRGADIEDMYSVGGAVFFNKASFIAGGMENEHMISFGPEDCERNDRFTMLGFNIARVKGYLHHINHWCGKDSSKFNPFFRANHNEIDKIRLMSRQELQEYVDSWSWTKRKLIEQMV